MKLISKKCLHTTVVSLCLVLLTSGCNTLLKKSSGASGDSGVASSGSMTNGGSDQVSTFRATDPVPPELAVPEFENVPDVINPTVEKWVQYFQGKGRDHMERYLARSTRYEKIMKKILRQNGLPEDLIYIALIESGFSPRAISRSAAVGYWQFIRGTGKRYGLQINTFIDERRDPVVATQAAAEYFKELYIEFNSWFLSMASYNVGEGRVRREIKRNKTNDFWALAKKRRLPKETVNYIPKFLAARMIAKNPEKFGFKEVPYEPPIEFETITLNQPVDMRQMAEKMNVDYAELKRLNPKYRGEVAPLENNKLVLRIPLASTELAMKCAKESAVKELIFIADRGETDVYKVRPGDTINRIARRFHTNIGLLRELNDFKRRVALKPGRTIFIPLRESESLQYELTQMQNRLNGKSTGGKAAGDLALYVVQEGDSLPEIALKNNMTMAELMDLNSLTEGDSLKNGTQLKVRKIVADQSEPVMDVNLASAKDVEKNDKADKSEKVDKSDKTEKTVIAANSVNNPVTATAATANSASASNAPDKVAEKADKTEKTEKVVVEDKAEKVNSSENKNNTEKAGTKELTAQNSNLPATAEVKQQVTQTTNSSSTAANIAAAATNNTDIALANKNATTSVDNTTATLAQNSTSDKLVSSLKKHMVKNGENLFRIAKKYGVSINAIKKVNKIKRRRTRIKAGTILIIPVEETDAEKSNSEKVDNTFYDYSVRKISFS